MKCINLGCGKKYIVDPRWENIDFVKGENIRAVNILEGLPYKDNSIDVIFSSHMLEHFTKSEAERHIRECYRVLKPNGILRIVVPDLEDICKEYLKILSLAKNDESYKTKYNYIVIELIDQMTRMQGGGEMQKYWEDSSSDLKYVAERTGYPQGYLQERQENKDNVFLMFLYKIKRVFIKNRIFATYLYGKFSLSGEQHKWMYDSFGLECLLKETGFCNINNLAYNVSSIENWKEFGLEIGNDGKEYKPHSLYMEAHKR